MRFLSVGFFIVAYRKDYFRKVPCEPIETRRNSAWHSMIKRECLFCKKMFPVKGVIILSGGCPPQPRSARIEMSEVNPQIKFQLRIIGFHIPAELIERLVRAHVVRQRILTAQLAGFIDSYFLSIQFKHSILFIRHPALLLFHATIERRKSCATNC